MLVPKHLSFLYDGDMEELRVLIVEDVEPMREVLAGILRRFGFKHIYQAADGEEGFAAFQRYKPDIVIADWHMEPIDGLEMTRWIRRSRYSVNRSVPIILITGFSDHSRIEGARDAGVTEIMLKPFTAEEFAKRLMYVIDRPRDFIASLNFFGPDRRRRPKKGYDGDNRRKLDPEVAD